MRAQSQGRATRECEHGVSAVSMSTGSVAFFISNPQIIHTYQPLTGSLILLQTSPHSS